jgi:hypothetical protein
MKPENRYSPHAATAILVVCGQYTWQLSEGAHIGYQTYLFLLPDCLTVGAFGGLRIYC